MSTIINLNVDPDSELITLTATEDNTLVTINVTIGESSGGGSSTTNLSYTASSTGGTITSDTGTDANLPLVDGTNAGLVSPGMKSTWDNSANKGTCEFPRVNYILWNCVIPTGANQALVTTSFYAFSIPTVDAYIKSFTILCQTFTSTTNIKLALYSVDMNTMNANFEQDLGTYAITSVGYKVLTFTPIKLDVTKNYIIMLKVDTGISFLRHQGNNTQFNSRFWYFTNNSTVIGSGGALGAVYADAFPATILITSVVNQSFYGITYNSTNA